MHCFVRVLVSLFLLGAAGVGTADPIFTGVGDSGGSEGTISQAIGVSADGEVVVGYLAFEWEDGVLTSLGSGDNAAAITPDHDTIVGTSGTGAVRWDSGTMSALASLGYGVFSGATAVSEDASIIAGYAFDSSGNTFAVVWDDGTPDVIATDLSADLSTSVDLSADGGIVVGTESTTSGTRGWSWESDTQTFLTPLTTGGDTEVYAISSDGDVIVGSSVSSSYSAGEAVLWDSGTPSGLGVLSGESSAVATVVSDDGSMVAGTSGDQIFLWDATNGMRSLRDHLEGDLCRDLGDWSLVPTSVVSLQPLDMSDDGLTLVGFGTNPEGDEEGWVIHLPDDPDADGDSDGVNDFCDNCVDVANTSQSDADGDGYGNACDGDFNDDFIVGVPDFGTFQTCFNLGSTGSGGPTEDPTCEESDMFGDDGVIGVPDFGAFKTSFNRGVPGPSGLPCAGSPPCP